MAIPPDTCSATHRERARLLICESEMNHDGDHCDGEATWPSGTPLASVGERIFDLHLR